MKIGRWRGRMIVEQPYGDTGGEGCYSSAQTDQYRRRAVPADNVRHLERILANANQRVHHTAELVATAHVTGRLSIQYRVVS